MSTKKWPFVKFTSQQFFGDFCKNLLYDLYDVNIKSCTVIKKRRQNRMFPFPIDPRDAQVTRP